MNSIAGPPTIGNWYRHLDKGELFQVVGFDEHSRTIEIQAVGGDIDEIDEDVWDTLPIAHGEPPEDATGPMDDLDSDAGSDLDSEAKPALWAEPRDLERLAEPEETPDTELDAVEGIAANPGSVRAAGDGTEPGASPAARPHARAPTATSRSWPRRQGARSRPKTR
jgi:hypothetical protein